LRKQNQNQETRTTTEIYNKPRLTQITTLTTTQNNTKITQNKLK